MYTKAKSNHSIMTYKLDANGNIIRGSYYFNYLERMPINKIVGQLRNGVFVYVDMLNKIQGTVENNKVTWYVYYKLIKTLTSNEINILNTNKQLCKDIYNSFNNKIVDDNTVEHISNYYKTQENWLHPFDTPESRRINGEEKIIKHLSDEDKQKFNIVDVIDNKGINRNPCISDRAIKYINLHNSITSLDDFKIICDKDICQYLIDDIVFHKELGWDIPIEPSNGCRYYGLGYRLERYLLNY